MTTKPTTERTLDQIEDDAARAVMAERDVDGRVLALIREAFALGAASRASPEEGRARGPRCDSETPVRTSLTAPPLQCGLSSWPLDAVLERLADAADHLRGDHGCDAHGHEGVLYAAQAARLHIAALRSPPPEPRPDEYVTGMLQRALEIVRLYCGDEDIDAIHAEFEAIGGVALMPPGAGGLAKRPPSPPTREDAGRDCGDCATTHHGQGQESAMREAVALLDGSGNREGADLLRRTFAFLRAPASSEGERHG